MYSPEMSDASFGRLAEAAVHYGCGRATYIVGVIAGVVGRNADRLDDATASRIHHLVDTRMREGRAGWDCDREEWGRLLGVLSGRTGSAGRPLSFSDTDEFWLTVVSAYRRDKRSADPFLSASDYEDIVRANLDALDRKWVHNLLRDTAEAYGNHWGEEEGPIRDPEGFASLGSLLESEYVRIVGDRPPRDLELVSRSQWD